jgi:putative endonuclease
MTADVSVRTGFHNNAEAHKYTYRAKDWELVFTIECKDKSQAIAFEKHIKNMKSKTYIQNLIKYPEMVENLK